MGCDIHYMVQIQTSPGIWKNRPDWKFFDGRSYNLFGVLANVRNYGELPYISDPRGFPEDVELDDTICAYEILGRWLGDHSFTYLTLAELLSFDYDQKCFNKRDLQTEPEPLRDYLPDEYFVNLKQLEYEMKYCGNNLTPHDVRILIGFDN